MLLCFTSDIRLLVCVVAGGFGHIFMTTFAEIRAAAPPLVFSPPDALHGDPSHGNAHTFVGSRGSSTDVVFDVMGADILGEGHPGMGQTLSKYGRSFGIFKDKLIESQQREGLWGGT